MGAPAEPFSALCNGVIQPFRQLGWFVCLSVTMVPGDLYCLWNRVYSGVLAEK